MIATVAGSSPDGLGPINASPNNLGRMRFRPGKAMEEPLSMGSQYANGAHPRAGTRHCQANCRADTRQPQLSIQRPAAAANSAAKSLYSFSMPSPSWKRTTPLSVIVAPTPLPDAASTSATGGLQSLTQGGAHSTCTLRYFELAPATTFDQNEQT